VLGIRDLILLWILELSSRFLGIEEGLLDYRIGNVSFSTREVGYADGIGNEFRVLRMRSAGNGRDVGAEGGGRVMTGSGRAML